MVLHWRMVVTTTNQFLTLKDNIEGDLLIEDIITIVYYPTTTVINGLITSNPIVSWRIANSQISKW
jgi:hypothetical protein